MEDDRMPFQMVAYMGLDTNGNDDFETAEFPTMGRAVRAMAEWSRVVSDIVIRRVDEWHGDEGIVAELYVARDGSCEPLIEFKFPTQPRQCWHGLSPNLLRVRWILDRMEARQETL
jgi:hypothetical protein